jgi:hypothetical protein
VLTRPSLIVITGGHGRSSWRFRPPIRHPGDDAAVVDPLLADDITVGERHRRRSYVFGGSLPELGRIDSGYTALSFGLDGWVRAALAERAPRPIETVGHAAGAIPPPPDGFIARHCGTRAPRPDADLGRVCARNPADGVIECRTSVQPELEIRLQHLLEIASLDPDAVSNVNAKAGKNLPAFSSAFALVRGDTGEIVAQGSFVPGRETSAFAPATAVAERYLAAALDFEFPPRSKKHVEVNAVKVGWPEPVAVGSVLKPLTAAAFERAAPEAARALRLSASARDLDQDKPLLGHKAPTASVWEDPATNADLPAYLAHSYNWFQAGIGLLATGLPAGKGELSAGGKPRTIADADVRTLSTMTFDKPLATRWDHEDVIGGAAGPHALDVTVLRKTPYWRAFEALLGRPLYVAGMRGDPERWRRSYDLCAARALPLAEADLSHDLASLTSIGPDSFALYKPGDVLTRPSVVPIGEYIQFLRGSGLHSIGSIIQVADAYARLIYDAPGAGGAYALAASWFPTAKADWRREPCAAGGEPGVHGGMCAVLQKGGTAGVDPALAKLLVDPRLEVYGAKTGTIDSLDTMMKGDACVEFNRAHTPANAPHDARYHLDCGSRKQRNDTLFAIGFGVKGTDGGVVPLVLVVQYQGVGGPLQFAARSALVFVDVIADYFR